MCIEHEHLPLSNVGLLCSCFEERLFKSSLMSSSACERIHSVVAEKKDLQGASLMSHHMHIGHHAKLDVRRALSLHTHYSLGRGGWVCGHFKSMTLELSVNE